MMKKALWLFKYIYTLLKYILRAKSVRERETHVVNNVYFFYLPSLQERSVFNRVLTSDSRGVKFMFELRPTFLSHFYWQR